MTPRTLVPVCFIHEVVVNWGMQTKGKVNQKHSDFGCEYFELLDVKGTGEQMSLGSG